LFLVLLTNFGFTLEDNFDLTVNANNSLHRFAPDETLTLFLAQLVRSYQAVLVLVVGNGPGSDFSTEGLRVGRVVYQETTETCRKPKEHWPKVQSFYFLALRVNQIQTVLNRSRIYLNIIDYLIETVYLYVYGSFKYPCLFRQEFNLNCLFLVSF
jgi:hypothetical protein